MFNYKLYNHSPVFLFSFDIIEQFISEQQHYEPNKVSHRLGRGLGRFLRCGGKEKGQGPNDDLKGIL